MGTIGYAVHSTRKKFLSWKCSQCNKINMGAVNVSVDAYSPGRSKSRANNLIDKTWDLRMMEERFDPGKDILYYRNCRCRYCNHREFWAEAKNPKLLLPGRLGGGLLCLLAMYVTMNGPESALLTYLCIVGLLLVVGVFYAGYASNKNDKLVSKIRKHPVTELPQASYELERMVRMTLARYPWNAEEILEKYKLLPTQEGW